MRVLSCNIRKSDVEDGPNNWVCRRGICTSVILSQAPDIVCFQEMRRQQYLDLRAAMPAFDAFGMTKTATCGHPINAIFFRRDAFDVIAAGGYWLSETPHIAGTSSWGSFSIRLVNWLRLSERASEAEFRVINTHLDHLSDRARMKQAEMIVSDAEAYPDTYRQILSGDMNVAKEHPVIKNFEKAGWQDTYTAAHGDEDPGFTYHAFEGPRHRVDGKRIDWLFFRGKVKTTDSAIIKDGEDGRYPSDHYFVRADINLYM